MILPDLSSEKIFSLDIETKDTGLKELGPGPRRKGNYILGVGIATQDREWYFSLNHPNSDNIQEDVFFDWLRQYTGKEVILARALYDLDWLQYKNIFFRNKIFDVQIIEPLLDENKYTYNLDSLGEQYLGIHKGTNEIAEICKQNGWKGKPQEHLWRLGSKIVGKYCKLDCRITYDVKGKQIPELEKQGLMNVFNMESKLIPLLLQMRRTGVRINLDKKEQLKIKYKKINDQLQKELNEMVGFDVNIYASKSSVKKAFDKLHLPYNYTQDRKDKKTSKIIKGGNPTFASKELEFNPHPLAQKILRLKKYHKAYKDFICGLDKFLIGDRIHTEFNPVRGENIGTVSGRFSSSKPNLQNMPSRDEKIAHDIRSMFIPEEGKDWLRGDYSQIEFRNLAHYARGTGAEEIRERYINDPTVDFHAVCADIAHIARKPAKNINFALVYGMGKEKLKRSLGLPDEEADEILLTYNKYFPFIKKTSYDVKNVAERRGYIKTIMNRRRRFPNSSWGYIKTIMNRRRRFPNSSFCYKALNSLLQGTAADILKAAMVKSYEAGIYDIIIPHLTVHDEMDNSVGKSKQETEAIKEMKYIFENTIKLKVPIIFNLEIGKNWAELKEYTI